MKKVMLVLTAAFAAFALMGQSAQAAKKKTKVVVTPPPVYWPVYGYWGVADPRLATSNLVVGGASTGAYFALKHHHGGWHGNGIPSGAAWAVASIGCAAASPIFGTLMVRRELTQREVSVSTANCFLPIIGGYLVNAAFDRNPQWEIRR